VSWIERVALRLRLLPEKPPQQGEAQTALVAAPPPEQWDDWTEIEARGWPGRRVVHHY
jgi:hypothetical protein